MPSARAAAHPGGTGAGATARGGGLRQPLILYIRGRHAVSRCVRGALRRATLPPQSQAAAGVAAERSSAMGEMVSFASNGGTAGGYLAKPAGGTGKGVIVIQEWWGLND